MKLIDILTETTKAKEVYMVHIKDGAGFNVSADSVSDARSMAKDKLRPGQVIDKVVKDRQTSQTIEDKKEKLIAYVDNNRTMQREPSTQKKFKRQIERATTPAKLQAVSDDITNHGTKDKKKSVTESVDELIKNTPIKGNANGDSNLIDKLHDIITDKNQPMKDRQKALGHIDKIMGEESRGLPSEKEIADYLAGN